MFPISKVMSQLSLLLPEVCTCSLPFTDFKGNLKKMVETSDSPITIGTHPATHWVVDQAGQTDREQLQCSPSQGERRLVPETDRVQKWPRYVERESPHSGWLMYSCPYPASQWVAGSATELRSVERESLGECELQFRGVDLSWARHKVIKCSNFSAVLLRPPKSENPDSG